MYPKEFDENGNRKPFYIFEKESGKIVAYCTNNRAVNLMLRILRAQSNTKYDWNFKI